MERLKQIIKEKGIVRSDSILDVSEFLNGIVDSRLMHDLGADFANHFRDYDFDAFATVESSGIAPSVFASYSANKPLIIIKKSEKQLDNRFIQQPSYSFTKSHPYYLTCLKEQIGGKRIILIDDFLAQGSVVKNVDLLLKQAGSELVAVGICITKAFQDGYRKLIEEGYDLYSQASIESMNPETSVIKFKNE